MNPRRNSLERILNLARRGWPPPAPPDAPPDAPRSVETIAFLARHSLTAAVRAARSPEPWRLWDRVGRWSLAGATAVLLLVAVLRPNPQAMADPFEAFTADVPDDVFEFAPRL